MRLRNPTAAHRDALLGLFAEAGTNAAGAAPLLERMLRSWPQNAELAGEIRNLEHEGDRITHDLLFEVQRSFVPPFDRGDAHRLASVIDDVLDYVDEAAEHIVMYKVDACPHHAVSLGGLIREAAQELAAETRQLGHPHRLGEGARRIDKLEHEADRTLRIGLASLSTASKIRSSCCAGRTS